MKTTYMHYRKFDRMGQIVPKGGMTVAIRQEGHELTVALSECGRKDLFNRKLGRTIAEGRLNSGSAIKLVLPQDTIAKSFVHNQNFIKEKVGKLLAGGK